MIRQKREQRSDGAADGPQRVYDHLLPRDSRRDPWGGMPVETSVELASGYYPERDRPGPDGHGYRDNPDDKRSGGDAGIVGRDERMRP